MQFTRRANTFRVSRITGPTHNLLGLEFADADSSDDVAMVPLERHSSGSDSLDPKGVRNNVLEAIEESNKEMGTSFHVKSIEFVENDSPPAEVYRYLAKQIVERIAKKLPFINA